MNHLRITEMSSTHTKATSQGSPVSSAFQPPWPYHEDDDDDNFGDPPAKELASPPPSLFGGAAASFKRRLI
ncbi:ABC transporter transmembrane region [Musa troglodytarum]|uniref:ABC transporter transmembrane region n=1 Tax=Musa troglodytarum TaxID=320322 RepID=A0A9E7HHB1_9LILI|nr:ABC transporter transmembrane region [Musa troglodytarum]